MSDIKPKRPAREPVRSDIASGEAVPVVTAPIVAPEPPAPAEPRPAAAVAAATPITTKGAASAAPVEAAAEDAWTALAAAQAAFARGFELAAVEMTGMTRSGFAATADAAIALLGAKTFAEAVEINAGLARRSVDALFEGSARLSEIGAKAVAEASRPILSRAGLSRAGGAWSGSAAH